jgi:glycosyltransferase involved in cell wall biosynthesis
VVNNISGLGAVFIKDGWLTRLVRGLYRLALSRSTRVFFQNEDDRQLFVEGGMVRFEQTDRLPGSGVDLAWFTPVPMPHNGERVRFLLIARMLWDKGVGEYAEAARIVRKRYPQVEFCLLGFLDVQNPAAISRKQMAFWVEEGVVIYLGVTDDVRPYIAASHCVVLPSYREGIPRSLLEAAAMCRPIITTDVVGCRETVDEGVNGYVCQPRDATGLAEKIEQMICLSPDSRAEMGRRGREKVEREFDERFVINRYLEVIEQIAVKIRQF